MFVEAGQADEVRLFAGAVAAETLAAMGWADRAAASLCGWPEAGDAVCDRHADRARFLALDAHAVSRHPGLAADDDRGDQLNELAGVDWAAAELKVDRDVLADRRALLE